MKLEAAAVISKNKFNKKSNFSFNLMLLPAVVLTIIYSYGPMYGITIAFQKFVPAKGLFGNQTWIGFDNFNYIFQMPDFYTILRNTVSIAFFKMVTGMVVPIIFAILINELYSTTIKRCIQTMIYLPHFISWVILSGIFIDILSPSTGIVNQVIKGMGFEPIFFLGSNKWFQFTMVITEVWKEFGFGTIIYLSAITSIDQNLYEAAIVDGASRWRQIWHITLPGMRPVIVLLGVLSLGSILSAGFDQIYNLYSPLVYQTGDILDTYVYRIGIEEAQYGLSTAIGLFRSVVSMIFISTSYYAAYKLADYRIF